MISTKRACDIVPGSDYIMGDDGKWYLVRQNRRAFLDKRLHFVSHAGASLSIPLSYDDLVAVSDMPPIVEQTVSQLLES